GRSMFVGRRPFCVLCGVDRPHSILLFVPLSARPRAPRSFPTRRSSDLVIRVPRIRIVNDVIDIRTTKPFTNPVSLAHTRSTPQRSEEHTSELQSRFDLVCRLLLEKKNKIPPHPAPGSL